MSIKKFCDYCGNEITAANDLRPNMFDKSVIGFADNKFCGVKRGLVFQVIIGRTRTIENGSSGLAINWNEGDWCKHCVIDVINIYDNRVKAHGN